MRTHARWVAGLVVLAGCATPSGVVTTGEPVGRPYAGPMDLPVSHADRASVVERSGTAGRALECEAAPYDGGGADYDSGLASVQRSAPRALANYLAEDGGPIPDRGYRVEREDDGRTLFSYDVGGRTKIALVAADDVHDYNGDEGWGIEAWAACDPSELPESVTEALGVQVWLDDSGHRVPVATVRSERGPAHCDWQDLTFLSLGPDRRGAQFVRDAGGELRAFLHSAFDPRATLPENAKDTGYHRGGRRLWLAADGRAAYLVAVGDPDDVERWPGAKDRVACS
jgi:hypothetical protein